MKIQQILRFGLLLMVCSMVFQFVAGQTTQGSLIINGSESDNLEEKVSSNVNDPFRQNTESPKSNPLEGEDRVISIQNQGPSEKGLTEMQEMPVLKFKDFVGFTSEIQAQIISNKDNIKFERILVSKIEFDSMSQTEQSRIVSNPLFFELR